MSAQFCFDGMERPEPRRREGLSKRAKALLHYLQAVYKLNGWLEPSLAFLCRKFKRSRATIERWLKELRDGGLLATHRQGQRSAKYQLFFQKVRRLFETSGAPVLIYESLKRERSVRASQKPPKSKDPIDYFEVERLYRAGMDLEEAKRLCTEAI